MGVRGWTPEGANRALAANHRSDCPSPLALAAALSSLPLVRQANLFTRLFNSAELGLVLEPPSSNKSRALAYARPGCDDMGAKGDIHSPRPSWAGSWGPPPSKKQMGTRKQIARGGSEGLLPPPSRCEGAAVAVPVIVNSPPSRPQLEAIPDHCVPCIPCIPHMHRYLPSSRRP
jgi:hypothetical protein